MLQESIANTQTVSPSRRRLLLASDLSCCDIEITVTSHDSDACAGCLEVSVRMGLLDTTLENTQSVRQQTITMMINHVKNIKLPWGVEWPTDGVESLFESTVMGIQLPLLVGVDNIKGALDFVDTAGTEMSVEVSEVAYTYAFVVGVEGNIETTRSALENLHKNQDITVELPPASTEIVAPVPCHGNSTKDTVTYACVCVLGYAGGPHGPCRKCSPGYYTNSDNSECVVCPAGFFCVGGHAKAACDSYSFLTSAPRSSSADMCFCEAGYQANTDHSKQDDEPCVLCDVGSHCGVRRSEETRSVQVTELAGLNALDNTELGTWFKKLEMATQRVYKASSATVGGFKYDSMLCAPITYKGTNYGATGYDLGTQQDLSAPTDTVRTTLGLARQGTVFSLVSHTVHINDTCKVPEFTNQEVHNAFASVLAIKVPNAELFSQEDQSNPQLKTVSVQFEVIGMTYEDKVSLIRAVWDTVSDASQQVLSTTTCFHRDVFTGDMSNAVFMELLGTELTVSPENLRTPVEVNSAVVDVLLSKSGKRTQSNDCPPLVFSYTVATLDGNIDTASNALTEDSDFLQLFGLDADSAVVGAFALSAPEYSTAMEPQCPSNSTRNASGVCECDEGNAGSVCTWCVPGSFAHTDAAKRSVACLPCPMDSFCLGGGHEQVCPGGAKAWAKTSTQALCFCPPSTSLGDSGCQKCDEDGAPLACTLQPPPLKQLRRIRVPEAARLSVMTKSEAEIWVQEGARLVEEMLDAQTSVLAALVFSVLMRFPLTLDTLAVSTSKFATTNTKKLQEAMSDALLAPHSLQTLVVDRHHVVCTGHFVFVRDSARELENGLAAGLSGLSVPVPVHVVVSDVIGTRGAKEMMVWFEAMGIVQDTKQDVAARVAGELFVFFKDKAPSAVFAWSEDLDVTLYAPTVGIFHAPASVIDKARAVLAQSIKAAAAATTELEFVEFEFVSILEDLPTGETHLENSEELLAWVQEATTAETPAQSISFGPAEPYLVVQGEEELCHQYASRKNTHQCECDHTSGYTGPIDTGPCTRCPPGFHILVGECVECQANHYCTDGISTQECPSPLVSVSPAGSSTREQCVCISGYTQNPQDNGCEECQSGGICQTTVLSANVPVFIEISALNQLDNTPAREQFVADVLLKMADLTQSPRVVLGDTGVTYAIDVQHDLLVPVLSSKTMRTAAELNTNLNAMLTNTAEGRVLHTSRETLVLRKRTLKWDAVLDRSSQTTAHVRRDIMADVAAFPGVFDVHVQKGDIHGQHIVRARVETLNMTVALEQSYVEALQQVVGLYTARHPGTAHVANTLALFTEAQVNTDALYSPAVVKTALSHVYGGVHIDDDDVSVAVNIKCLDVTDFSWVDRPDSLGPDYEFGPLKVDRQVLKDCVANAERNINRVCVCHSNFVRNALGDCVSCEAGTFQEGLECVACRAGYFCKAGVRPTICPSTSSSQPNSALREHCFCTQGFKKNILPGDPAGFECLQPRDGENPPGEPDREVAFSWVFDQLTGLESAGSSADITHLETRLLHEVQAGLRAAPGGTDSMSVQLAETSCVYHISVSETKDWNLRTLLNIPKVESHYAMYSAGLGLLSVAEHTLEITGTVAHELAGPLDVEFEVREFVLETYQLITSNMLSVEVRGTALEEYRVTVHINLRVDQDTLDDTDPANILVRLGRFVTDINNKHATSGRDEYMSTGPCDLERGTGTCTTQHVAFELGSTSMQPPVVMLGQLWADTQTASVLGARVESMAVHLLLTQKLSSGGISDIGAVLLQTPSFLDAVEAITGNSGGGGVSVEVTPGVSVVSCAPDTTRLGGRCRCDASFEANGQADNGCIACTRGHFCPGAGVRKSCPAALREGSIVDNPGAFYGLSRETQCTCPPGFLKTTVGCELCQANSYCSDGARQSECPAHSWSESGSESRGDCVCDGGFQIKSTSTLPSVTPLLSLDESSTECRECGADCTLSNLAFDINLPAVTLVDYGGSAEDATAAVITEATKSAGGAKVEMRRVLSRFQYKRPITNNMMGKYKSSFPSSVTSTLEQNVDTTGAVSHANVTVSTPSLVLESVIYSLYELDVLKDFAKQLRDKASPPPAPATVRSGRHGVFGVGVYAGHDCRVRSTD